MIFVVNVGPKLAKDIDCSENENDVINYLGSRNNCSIYIQPVVEQEILQIVNNCKNKTSLDCEGFSMSTVKKIILNVVKPLTYICNLSFVNGIFPDKT